jgi:hypothetical protein
MPMPLKRISKDTEPGPRKLVKMLMLLPTKEMPSRTKKVKLLKITSKNTVDSMEKSTPCAACKEISKERLMNSRSYSRGSKMSNKRTKTKEEKLPMRRMSKEASRLKKELLNTELETERTQRPRSTMHTHTLNKCMKRSTRSTRSSTLPLPPRNIRNSINNSEI